MSRNNPSNCIIKWLVMAGDFVVLSLVFLMLCLLGVAEGKAQVFEADSRNDGITDSRNDGKATENVVVADGFWKNWFVQLGLDMTLQNPYGYDFSNVFPNGKSFGLDVAAGTNGYFNIDFGVRLDIGENMFYRPNRGQSLCNSRSYSQQGQSPVQSPGHNWPRFAVNTIASVGVAYVGKTALKAMIKEERPDHSDNKSFPSGHAAMAFAAARSINKEFRKDCIWIPIAGYAAATAVGIERVASDRHH